MAKVIVSRLVENKLRHLTELLYDEEYFGFKEDAQAYVHKISDFIQSIPSQRYKLTKYKNDGTYYCKYEPNRNTTWFISFDVKDEVYLIKNIINNHSKDYADFM